MVGHVRDTDDYPNEWARLIDQLAQPPRSKTSLAKELDVDRRTVHRYIDGTSVNIPAPIIRRVAELAGMSLDETTDIALGAQAKERADTERALRVIQDDPDASDELKARLVDHVRKMSTEHADARLRYVESILDETRAKA